MTETDEVNREAIDILNRLIETCHDGHEGFREAADGASDTELKGIFTRYSEQRANYAGELENLVRQLGGEPEQSGSIAGAVHRGWINLKTAIAGNDDKAILNEAERGEDSARSAYEDALENEHLPEAIRTTIQVQYEGVLAAHDHIKSLRDAANQPTASSARI